jgi:dolichol-phosphate mannosyltransferase
LTSENSRTNQLRVDIIVPVFNEDEAVSRFHTQLCQTIDGLPYAFRIFYIDDGSSDGTAAALDALAREDGRIETVQLSRNFGHQAALTAGLDRSTADFAITMDGDGEHPPALIAEMLRLGQAGYDLVLTQRIEPEGLGWFKRWTSQAFYRLINRVGDTNILPGGADFRLYSRAAVQALRAMPEYHRFLRGMVAWMGFRSVILPFEQPERLAGESKYSLRKMLRLSADAVFSFSLIPLYIGISVGVIFLLLALLEAIYVLSFWVTGNTSQLAPGWSSLMFVLLIVGGSLMISLGFIGVYIGYIFQEVKRRPVYIVRNQTVRHADSDCAEEDAR